MARMKLLLGALALVLLVPAAPAATGAVGTSDSAADTPRSAATTPTPARQKAAPTIGARRQVRELQHPLGREADPRRAVADHRARPGPAPPRGRQHPTGGLPQREDLGVRRDRPDVAWRSTRTSPTTAASTPARAGRRGRRARRPGDRVAAQRRRDPRPPSRDPGRRLPDHQRASRRLPAADHRATARCWSAPATPRSGSNPRNLTSLGGKTLRLNRITGKPVARQPVRQRRQQAQALRLHLRPPQRPGSRPARDGTLWSVEHGSFRDDEVNRLGGGARLRLAPGARLQRERPDDRPVAAGPAGHARAGAPATRPSPRPGPPGSTARSGARSTAPSPWPASRRNRVIFMKFDGPGASSGRVPRGAAPVRAAPLGHAGPEQRPADHHRQRRATTRSLRVSPR